MAEIGEVYGKNYENDAVIGKMKYAAKILASNIAHKNFTFRFDSQSMWNKHNMTEESIKILIKQTQIINPQFRMTHVSKSSDKVNMFPYLINGAVEYFVITDLSGEKTMLYSIYITPSVMEPF